MVKTHSFQLDNKLINFTFTVSTMSFFSHHLDIFIFCLREVFCLAYFDTQKGNTAFAPGSGRTAVCHCINSAYSADL